MISPALTTKLKSLNGDSSERDILDFCLSFETETGNLDLAEQIIELSDVSEMLAFLSNRFGVSLLSKKTTPVETMSRVASKDSVQTKQIFELILFLERDSFTSEEIWTEYNKWGTVNHKQWSDIPITSVRRAMNSLAENKYIIKQEEYVPGTKGVGVAAWDLVKSKWEGIIPVKSKSTEEKILKDKYLLEEKIMNFAPKSGGRALRELQETFISCMTNTTGGPNWKPLEEKIKSIRSMLDRRIIEGKT